MEILKKIIENTEIIKLEIGMEKKSDAPAINGSVELDIENQDLFVNTINSIFEDNKTKIIVDMSNISYIDSSGLWALFEGHKKASQKNGKMVLLNPTKDVQRVLDITKMSSKMEIYTDEREAITSLN